MLFDRSTEEKTVFRNMVDSVGRVPKMMLCISSNSSRIYLWVGMTMVVRFFGGVGCFRTRPPSSH